MMLTLESIGERALAEAVQGFQPLAQDTGRRVFNSRAEFEAYAAAVRESQCYRFGEFVVDPIAMTCSAAQLTITECEVLLALVRALPNPLSAKAIAESVSVGRRYPMDPDHARLWIRRLRAKVGYPRVVTTEHGYVFVPFPENA